MKTLTQLLLVLAIFLFSATGKERSVAQEPSAQSAAVVDPCHPYPAYGTTYKQCTTRMVIESGTGSKFGRWYQIIPHPPQGYEPGPQPNPEFAYELRGEHRCEGNEKSPFVEKNGIPGKKQWGSLAWAECYAVLNPKTGVVLYVRLQGQTETSTYITLNQDGPGLRHDEQGTRMKEEFVLLTMWRKSLKGGDASKP